MEMFSERYGWTPSQIRKEGYEDLLDYLDIIDIKKKKERQKNKKLKRK